MGSGPSGNLPLHINVLRRTIMADFEPEVEMVSCLHMHKVLLLRTAANVTSKQCSGVMSL